MGEKNGFQKVNEALRLFSNSMPFQREQEIISLFFINTDRFRALDLKSEKWSVIRDKGVEVACPMITEKNTGDKMNTQRAETMPALTQTPQTDNKYTSAKNTALGLPGPP